MDDREQSEDHKTDEENTHQSDHEKSIASDDSVLNDSVANEEDTIEVDVDNKVDVDQTSQMTTTNEKVAVETNNNKDQSYELAELAKISLGTSETENSVDSEDMDHKDDDNDNPPTRSSRSTRRNMPEGGYAALNSGKKKAEKRENRPKKKEVKKQIQEKNIILHLENENKKLKHELENTNDENQQLAEQNESLHNENDQLTLKINQLTQELNDLQQQMIDTKERLQNEIDNLKEEKKSSRREHKKAREKLEEQIRQEQQSREAAENSKRVLEGALDLATKKNNEMEKELIKQRRTHQSGTNSPPARPAKHKITLLGDSNARRTAQQMQKPGRIYKTEYVEALDLESAAAWTNTINTKPDNTTVVILVGTNDIRRGKSAAQCDKEHQSITEKLNDLEIPHAIIQAPPIYAVQLKDRQLEREVVKFNTRLESRLNANTLISMEDLENDRSLIDKRDGIHLTPHSSQMVATLIENHILKTNEPNVAVDQTTEDRTVEMDNNNVIITLPSQTQPTPQQPSRDPTTKTTPTTTDKFGDTVEVVETDTRRAAKIIGQGGNRIEKFKITQKVKIDTTYTDNKTIFIIRGEKDLTTKAKSEMIKQINDIKREDERRDQTIDRKIDVTCRYYQTGYCMYGSRCRFRHDQKPVDLSTITPPPPQQENRSRKETSDNRHYKDPRHYKRPDNRTKYTDETDRDDSDNSSPRRSWRPDPPKRDQRTRSRSPLAEMDRNRERIRKNSPKSHSTPKRRSPDRTPSHSQERKKYKTRTESTHHTQKKDKQDREKRKKQPSRQTTPERPRGQSRRRDRTPSPDQNRRRRERITSEELDSAIEILMKAKRFK